MYPSAADEPYVFTSCAPSGGLVLDGKYRLEAKIAEGGMGSVWLGVHLSLGIDVAIKLMKPVVAEQLDLASFEREAHAAARIRSEHVVRMYDHGLTPDGLPYLVMEYLAGESLAEKVEQTGPLRVAEVASVVRQIACALTETHREGIVHGDVKPDNVVLVPCESRRFGCATLVDYGIASSCLSNRQGGDRISGTPCYMSPEHLRGAAHPSPAFDTWALAASAFTALTATLPFDGTTFSAIVQSVCVDPLPVPSRFNPSLPREIDAWFARACARSVEERYATPLALADALDACVGAASRVRPLHAVVSRPSARRSTLTRSIKAETMADGEPLSLLVG